MGKNYSTSAQLSYKQLLTDTLGAWGGADVAVSKRAWSTRVSVDKRRAWRKRIAGIESLAEVDFYRQRR